MQQIVDWLEKLGMSEYTQRFAENDIDTSVLRHLTDQDLEELGVCSGIDERYWQRLRSLAVPFRRRRSRRLPSRRPKTPPRRPVSKRPLRQSEIAFRDKSEVSDCPGNEEVVETTI